VIKMLPVRILLEETQILLDGLQIPRSLGKVTETLYPPPLIMEKWMDGNI